MVHPFGLGASSERASQLLSRQEDQLTLVTRAPHLPASVPESTASLPSSTRNEWLRPAICVSGGCMKSFCSRVLSVLLLAISLAHLSRAATPVVHVTAPSNGASVTGPVNYVASAT